MRGARNRARGVAFCKGESDREGEKERSVSILSGGEREKRKRRTREREESETYGMSSFSRSFPSSLASSADGVSNDED